MAVFKENDDRFDTPEWKSGRRLEYLEEHLEDLRTRYDKEMEEDGSISPGLESEIKNLYDSVKW